MFYNVEHNRILYYKSDMIKSRHAFTTRLFGISINESTKYLNLAFGRGDSDGTVKENIKIICREIDVDESKLISLNQVHGNTVLKVDKSMAGLGTYKKSILEADGYYTIENDLPIGVKVADCTPILIEGRDDNGKVKIVSAVHAGWKGTAEKIVQTAIQEMISEGIKKENIYVAIGPSICKQCYEVKQDFYNAIYEKLGQYYCDNYIKYNNNDGKMYADVKGMNYQQLIDVGIQKNNIDLSDICTFENPETFYSHRYSKGNRGTQMAIICK